MKQPLDDPVYPQVTYRRGAGGQPEPVLRGSGLRVQTVAVAARQWELPPARIAEEFWQSEGAIREEGCFAPADLATLHGHLVGATRVFASETGLQETAYG